MYKINMLYKWSLKSLLAGCVSEREACAWLCVRTRGMWLVVCPNTMPWMTVSCVACLCTSAVISIVCIESVTLSD